MNLTKQFFKYVSQNIFGLLGTSCYILADTYFISQAAGTDGVTLLNLCLPIYNFIFAIGAMVGLGAATRYAILRAQGDERCQRYFSNAIFCACALSVPFLLAGIFAPGSLLRLMGGDAEIVALGVPYARIFLMFTPFFMCNYIVSAFVRNDGDPSLVMVATLSSSLFNVVFDYIFMFPMGLGLAGAALATAVSPIISISICSRHFFQKDNTVQFVRQLPSAKLLGQSCQLGISGFVGELSSAVTTTVFNFLLLRLAGNVGVAAYGVVANFALVATAIFNGVAQGAQPLISQCYGKNEMAGAKKLLLLGCGTALALAAVLMVWSVLGGTGSASSSSMEYSTVVHYFESLQVTQFSLDLNTGVITMNLKEGGKNNLPFVHWASFRLLPVLLEAGVRVWFQPPPFAHTKLLAVDGYYCQIGSANLDARSMRLNFELNMEIFDPEFHTAMALHMDMTIARSREVTLKDLQERLLILKLRDAACWLFSPYL